MSSPSADVRHAASAPSRGWRPATILAVAVAAYVLLYLQTPFDFWFEDDANVAAAVADAPGPWTFFRHDTLWWRSRGTESGMVERRDLYEGVARQAGLSP